MSLCRVLCFIQFLISFLFYFHGPVEGLEAGEEESSALFPQPWRPPPLNKGIFDQMLLRDIKVRDHAAAFSSIYFFSVIVLHHLDGTELPL